MSAIAEGLAATGVVLILVALVCSFAAEPSLTYRAERRIVAVGWTTFALGVLAVLAAVWLAVLS
ncbi:hypothetical protein ACFQHV_01070 [Promicromonospora thailandica]|uniref:Uncharacterized protein n=1 Tax=Promicromonospora thailandica TaxID=765201 RepID=A0A9X2G1Y0_9MICO|nr:hypothetical protein [Promicromonospora thailandica]MCP2265555.1 hypothetical protein [Promicromonospora thailandica]BFF17120.1 hypothetical protein GCM10025730_06410 [Promicromonospora thailandica]